MTTLPKLSQRLLAAAPEESREDRNKTVKQMGAGRDEGDAQGFLL